MLVLHFNGYFNLTSVVTGKEGDEGFPQQVETDGVCGDRIIAPAVA